MSSLIWVQTVCKGYQQRTLGGKEFIQYHFRHVRQRVNVPSTVLGFSFIVPFCGSGTSTEGGNKGKGIVLLNLDIFL